ncbi:hypothetical protein BDF22DRAFT_251436 [Syncephalis plumigaleata]|nr:hypothetical protein BDF22DRAFT_251436 [Syncephalis plumigaleata]
MAYCTNAYCLCRLIARGVAFGRSRHRLHVPLQIIMVVLAGIGYYLAFHRHDHRTAHQKSRHATTKRFFEKTPHVWLGIILVWLLGFQVAFGIGRKLLKMRWPDQPLANNGDGSNNDRLRGRIARMISLTLSACHRWLGGVHIVIVYLQIMFGIIKLGHFCRADATSMCWERYTTGSYYGGRQ